MKHLLALALALAVAGCGFQPAYSPASAAASGGISVPEIEGRSGHALRKALIEELATGLPGITEASLVVTLEEQLNRLAIRPDEAAARSDVIATGRYVLDTGDRALTGSTRTETSFNVPVSAFGDIAAQTAAADRAMGTLARRIVEDLRLQLARDP